MSDAGLRGGPFCSAVLDHIAATETATSELEEYLKGLRARHEVIERELKELAEELLKLGFRPSIAALQERSQQLQAAFHKVDELKETMDQINELILIVFAAVKAIDSAPDVMGKASSFLASFGLALKSERANAGLWSRVPSYAMLKSRTPKDFLKGVRTVFAPLCPTDGSRGDCNRL
ncbi:hypothetical protein TcYC6_0016160 [Trypanosoma cruzi]|nr:hypothetical protein TcYC6_0016160 [Trypanosoma cruzi]